jgi:hypothetical protein
LGELVLEILILGWIVGESMISGRICYRYTLILACLIGLTAHAKILSGLVLALRRLTLGRTCELVLVVQILIGLVLAGQTLAERAVSAFDVNYLSYCVRWVLKNLFPS